MEIKLSIHESEKYNTDELFNDSVRMAVEFLAYLTKGDVLVRDAYGSLIETVADPKQGEQGGD